MPFISIEDILPKSIKRTGVSKQIIDSFLLAKIPKVIADTLEIEIIDRVKPLYIKQKVLMLACVDERLELVIKEEEEKIVQAFLEKFGVDRINKIQFLN